MSFDTSHHGVNILLIDANDEERQHFAHQLRMCSPIYLVQEASSGAAGLELYRSHQFDCVILELVLPDMSAFSVLVSLVPDAGKPVIPVVMLTHLDLPRMSQLALRNGAQACLVKTRTSGDDLDKAVQQAMVDVGSLRKDKPRGRIPCA